MLCLCADKRNRQSAEIMSERALNVRHSRVSPIPGRGSAVAYSPCPGSDPDMLGSSNVLAIPMSAIQTTNSAASTNNNNNNNGSSNGNLNNNAPPAGRFVAFCYCSFCLRIFFVYVRVLEFRFPNITLIILYIMIVCARACVRARSF